MKRTPCLGMFLGLVIGACTAPEPARNPKKHPVLFATPPTLEAQAQEASSASRPRKEHLALEPLVGAWKTELVSVAVDGTESDPHPGTATVQPVLGGRYYTWDATLDVGAKVYETTGYLGYDINSAEYQLLMISDLATGMSVAHGRGDIEAKGIQLVIEVVDPSTGAIKRAQSTLRVVNKDHFVLEQLGLDPNGEQRIVRRTHYRRRGAAKS
jgi:hypothetical protein